MTDEKYLFISDIREKKANNRAVYSKRSGAKTRYVSLPSDHLTAAEKKRRNGPVSTVKLNQPITYPELKALTPTMQFLYLDHLTHEYKARQSDLAAMLGVTLACVNKYVKKLPGKLEFSTLRAKKPAPEWLAFMSGGAEEIVPEDTRADEPIAPETTAEVMPVTIDQPLGAKPTVLPTIISFTLSGTTDQLADLLAVFTKPGAVYDFSITVREKGGD